MIFGECSQLPKPLSSPSSQLKQKLSFVHLGQLAGNKSFFGQISPEMKDQERGPSDQAERATRFPSIDLSAYAKFVARLFELLSTEGNQDQL